MSASLLVLAVLVTSGGPRFIEDDFGRALAKAKKEKKLLFVDAWAPWCHSCVYMREHVLRRPAFAAYEKDVVFAALDTEKASSAAFLEKYPVDVLPTLFFIDAGTGRLVFKWLGSTDEAQMRGLLDAARGRGGAGALVEADGLFASGQAAAAAERYLSAVKEAPAGGQGRAVLSMLSALTLAKEHDTCARTALEELERLETAGERVNGVAWGLSCALELPEGEVRARAVEALAKRGLELLDSERMLEGALADDVSGLYELLVQAAGAPAEAGALAVRWLDYLEGQAAQATTPAARAVFDPHRVAAALAAGTPARVVAALEASERELPKDYNPPARLALVLRELGQHEAALGAAERALSKCAAGPRRLRLYDTKLSVLEKLGRVDEGRRVLGEMVTYARRLPRAQLGRERLAALEKRLTEGR